MQKSPEPIAVSKDKILVEVLLYLAIGLRVFGDKLGIFSVPGLSGAIILFAGVVCFLVLIVKKEPLPVSVCFAFVLNLFANAVDLMQTGVLANEMLFWLSLLLMACYVVRDDRATLRFVFFVALVVLVAVLQSSIFLGETHGIKRLALSDKGGASVFANSNSLAQVSYVTAIVLLFAALRCRKFLMLACILVAAMLSTITLLTLSRQGLILLGIGLFIYLVALLMNRVVNIFLILLAFAVIGIGLTYSGVIDDIKKGYEYRLAQGSGRTEYLETAPKDMLETLMSGQGSQKGYSSVGIKPHNTFLWLHLAFGGVCALVYAVWLFWLSLKTWSLLQFGKIEKIAKYEVFALFLLFVLGQFTTIFAPGNYGYILGIALIEKYIWLDGVLFSQGAAALVAETPGYGHKNVKVEGSYA